MLFSRLAALTAALLLVAPGAHAAEPSTSFGDRFFRGTSPGALPTEKLALIAGLYVGAATSVGVGIGTLFSAASKHDDTEQFKQSQPRGFCIDLASSACASYRRALDSERSRREAGYMLLGLGGLLALSGGITAELWHNDSGPRVALSVQPNALSLGLSGSF